MTYEEIKEISSRFESFKYHIEDISLDVENIKGEPDFDFFEARIEVEFDGGTVEVVRIKIDEDPEEGGIYVGKNGCYGLSFEQRVEQERAYDVCKGIVKDYLNDSIISGRVENVWNTRTIHRRNK